MDWPKSSLSKNQEDFMILENRDNTFNNYVISTLILVSVFFISLLEFSVNIAGTGITANYFYILIPILVFAKVLDRPFVLRKEILLILMLLGIIYLAGVWGDLFTVYTQTGQLFRRFASFGAFIIPFTLCFVKFKKEDLYTFKMAFVLGCLYYALERIGTFLFLSLDHNTYNLKGLVGSQRYGFVLAFGFYIALFNKDLLFKKYVWGQRLFITLALFISMIITFSRATVVAAVGAIAFLGLLKLLKRGPYVEEVKVGKKKKINFKAIIIKVTAFIVILYFLALNFGDTGIIKHYKNRFTEPFQFNSVSSMMNPDSSEGYRFKLIVDSLSYIASNPFTGSNFKGLYLLYAKFKGTASTHNQYVDVFLRTGILGILIRIFLLTKIYRFCRRDPGLLAGFVSILIYGLVHETFKLSYGSFIFGMLLSFSYCKDCYLPLKKQETIS
jgi:hypothetical protein